MRTFSLVFAALLLSAASVHAQQEDLEGPLAPPLLYVGGNLFGAVPQGEFGDQVGTGFGGSAHAILRLDRQGLLGLRLDAGFINYGHESKRVPFSSTVGGRVHVDVDTDNNIAFMGIGPQFLLPTGALRPYLAASAGVSYFFTESSVEDPRVGSDERLAREVNFDDLTFAWGGAGGLYIPLSRGATPVSLDLGVRYHNNGEVKYLREGSIEDNPDLTISINPLQTRADLLTLQLGVSVGIPRRVPQPRGF